MQQGPHKAVTSYAPPAEPAVHDHRSGPAPLLDVQHVIPNQALTSSWILLQLHALVPFLDIIEHMKKLAHGRR